MRRSIWYVLSRLCVWGPLATSYSAFFNSSTRRLVLFRVQAADGTQQSQLLKIAGWHTAHLTRLHLPVYDLVEMVQCHMALSEKLVLERHGVSSCAPSESPYFLWSAVSSIAYHPD
jgi:hypothetical protein